MSAISDIKSGVATGETTAEATTEAALTAAEALQSDLNVFLQIDRAGALVRAKAIDTQQRNGASLPVLAGVPIAIKDNICVRGLQTSCGSRILGDYHPPYDATVIERLQHAGAVIIGKTNCDEFAMGSSNENSAFGPVRNPWNVERVPGGSSGGSAAAVAAGIVPVALGSDTGGSVRQPASLCGVVGMKPTYGRNSRYGLVAFASSLDQVGIFGRSTRDVATVLGVIAGRDLHDATTADVAVPDYASELDADLKKLRLGFPRALFGEGLDDDVRATVEQSIETYRGLGVEIVDVDLPNAKYCIAVYYIIATAEASSNLARFDGARYGFRAEETPELRQMYRKTRDEGFGAEVKRRIMLGTYVLSAGYYDAYYRKAMQARTLIAGDFRTVFAGGVHALFTPTTPTPAFPFGSRSDPYQMYLSDIFTCTANLAGVPALSLPIGRVGKLPVGGQIITSHFDEPRMFQVAAALERILGVEAHQ